MKSARFYLGRTLLALCAVLFISSGFVSCKQDDDSAEQTYELSKIAPELAGTWKSTWGDSYTITATTFTNYQYEGADASYTLNLVAAAKVEGTDKPTYYLYYKSPETYTYSSEYNGVTYSGTYYTKGYYTAVRVIVTSDHSLDICCAYNNVSEDKSLSKVKKDFTISNGYFGSNTEYISSTYVSEPAYTYFVRRSYSDPSDSTYTAMLDDDTYWDVLIFTDSDTTQFTEVTYPVDSETGKRVREEYTWKFEDDYYYMYDSDDEKLNGAEVEFGTDGKITRTAAIDIKYLEYLDMMYVKEIFEQVTDTTLIPTEDSYDDE